MAQWLITDLSVSDVHFQLWMLLVTGILFFSGFSASGQRGSAACWLDAISRKICDQPFLGATSVCSGECMRAIGSAGSGIGMTKYY